MKIGINFLPYAPGMQGGAEVYLKYITSSLKKIDTKNEYFPIVSELSKGKYLFDSSENFVEILVNKSSGNRIKRIIAEQFYLPKIIKSHNLDLIISNYTIPIFASCKTIVIIHDLQYKRMPELFERSKLLYWNIMIPLSIIKSNLIGTISKFSNSEIEHFFPLAKNKIFLTSEGIKESINSIAKKFEFHTSKKENFILSVSTFGKHKNLVTLIQAMKNVQERMPQLKLKLVGEARTPDAIKNKQYLTTLVKDMNLEENIIFLNSVSDEQLAELYNRSQAFIFPSLYEGFGLPLIEAQNCGSPVICSDAGSLPEIGGDSCILFDPLNSIELANKIITLVKNEQMQKDLIAKGFRNIERYSWAKGAKQLLTAIQGLDDSE